MHVSGQMINIAGSTLGGPSSPHKNLDKSGAAQVLPLFPVPAEAVRHAGDDVADHHLTDAPRRLVLGGRR